MNKLLQVVDWASAAAADAAAATSELPRHLHRGFMARAGCDQPAGTRPGFTALAANRLAVVCNCL